MHTEVYEIHITNPHIELDNTWKKLTIELDKGEHPVQPMFSKYLRTTEEEALSIVKDIPCDRAKVEQYTNIPEWCSGLYYEYHLKMAHDHPSVPSGTYGGKLSKNAQKDGRFITLRSEDYRDIEQRFELLRYRLARLDIPYSNVQKELVIYDSNLDLDKGW